MCIAHLRVSCLHSELLYVSSTALTLAAAIPKTLADFIALSLLWVKNNLVCECTSVIHLLREIKVKNLSSTSVISRGDTHLSIGYQDHEKCFGRAQGVDAERRGVHLVLGSS